MLAVVSAISVATMKSTPESEILMSLSCGAPPRSTRKRVGRGRAVACASRDPEARPGQIHIGTRRA
jgi:hypothetical protein